MRERPILFNVHMVRAILENRKTQTRRMMKPQPELRIGGFWHWKDCQWADGGLGFPKSGIEDHAPYRPGDRLWVRETFSVWIDDFGNPIIEYRADADDKAPATGSLANRWIPSIHMPRELSRITLEVTEVWAERVQDISAEDVLAEGVKARPTGNGRQRYFCPVHARQAGKGADVESYAYGGAWLRDAADAYHGLWNSIYGPDAWESNPWVWVICFRVLEVKE